MPNNRYLQLSLPKVDAIAMLALLRFAEKELDRPLTFEERRAKDSLEFACEGKDRRKTNRHNTPKRPRVELDLRRPA